MIVTRLAVALGVVALGVACWAAVAGSSIAMELLITAVALVVLVGGGNWLSGRRPAPSGRPGPAPGAPGRSPGTGEAPTDGAGPGEP